LETASSFQNSFFFVTHFLLETASSFYHPLSIGFWLDSFVFNTIRHFQELHNEFARIGNTKELQTGTRELVCGSHGLAAN